MVETIKSCDRNGLYHHKHKYIERIREMTNDTTITMTTAWIKDDTKEILELLSSKYRDNMIIQWYIYNKTIHGDDSMLYENETTNEYE